MKWIKITILISAILHLTVDAAPTGAPLQACETLLPNHPPFSPQATSPPIEIEVSTRGILPFTRTNITLRATGGTQFAGFLIQARTLNDDSVVGRFYSIDNDVQPLNCFAMIQSAATHTNNVPKSEVVLEWEAPDIISDPIVFQLYVTIVQSAAIFWPPIRSEMYAVVPEPTTTDSPNDYEFIYEGCGDVKLCFGLPSGCVGSRNCDLLSTVFDNAGDFEFELLGAGDHNYIAFGLSQTQSMQEASVIECVQQGGIISVFTSWNFPLGQGINSRDEVPQNIIRTLESRMIDNRIYCKLQRDEVSVIRGFPFNLRNMRHHLLIAGSGFLGPDLTVGFHGANRAISSERVWLAAPSAEYPIYEECGISKVCIGVPDGCFFTRNCNMLATVYDNNGEFEFELLGLVGHNWIGFGLSQSPSMADASVIECINQAGVITAFTSWNEGAGIRANTRVDIPQTIIRPLETRFIDGRIYCKLQRDEFSTVRGQDFHLRNEKHHLLIAGGPTVTVNAVTNHGSANREFTRDKRWLVPPPEETTTTTTTVAPPPPPNNPIYDGCKVTKVCFGIPDGCVSSGNCEMLTTVFDNNGNFEFELLGAATHNYIAFGLSQTRSMGDASVIECVNQGGNILGFTSWNLALFNERTDVPQNIIRTLEARFIDGRIYCKLERDIFSQVRGQGFHLEDQKHFLLMAGGVEIFAQSVGPHLNRGVSDERVNLTEPGPVRKAPLSPLMLTHGSFMIVAWIGCASIGIVMARHFKPSWPNRKIFGKDVWFIWHVTCMFLTWALTLIGFILIFVDVGQWNPSVHAVMGCVVLGLVILQAIGGAARPDPKAKGRPVFNWMHKSFGNITHLLAVLTIFFAVPLSASRLPDYTTFVLVGFVSYYLLMHIILTTVDVCSQMKRKKRLGVEINKNARYELLKQTLFGIHVVIVTLFVVALVLIFTLNPF